MRCGRLDAVFPAGGILDFHRARAVQAEHGEAGVGGERLDAPAVLHGQRVGGGEGFGGPRLVAVDLADLALRCVVDDELIENEGEAGHREDGGDPAAGA